MNKRSLAGGLALVLGASALLPSEANADVLKVQFANNPFISANSLNVRHLTNATELFDNKDNDLGSGGNLSIYSATTYPAHTELQTDSRPTNSLTKISGKIRGSGLISSAPVDMKFTLTNSTDFLTKNVQGALYRVTNGVRGDLLGVYDLKQMAASNSSIPLIVTNGPCYDFDVKFTSKLVSPNIESIVSGAGNSNRLEVSGVSGGEYIVPQISTNLVDWVPLSTNYIPVNVQNFGTTATATITVPMSFPDAPLDNTFSPPAQAPLRNAFYRIKVQ